MKLFDNMLYSEYIIYISVEGICNGIKAGSVDIKFEVTSCPGITGGVCQTGYASASYMVIEESHYLN